MRRNLLTLAVTLCWLLTMAVLVNRHYGTAGAPAAVETTPASPGEHWMGIYREGEKIGYLSARLEKSGTGYRGHEAALMRVKVMGAEKRIEMTTDALLNESFRLRSFTFNMKSDMDMTVAGEIKGKTLYLKITSGDIDSERKIPLDDEPYMNLSILPRLKEGFEKGKKIRLPLIDPSTLTQGVMELEVVGKEPMTILGQKIAALRIKGAFKGMELDIWATDEGEILKEESAGLTFIREEKESAIKLDRPSVDLIAGMAVPFDIELPDNIAYLKVRLRGIDFSGLELDGGNQKLSGDILEIKVPDFRKGSHEPSKEGLDEYLADTVFIQSKDPEIIEAADDIAGGKKEPLEKAKAIYEWVLGSIEKVPALTIPSAVEVLKSRRGDCNEHTALFTALVRASGIPARAAVGVVYRKGYFYYHAWPEIYAGGWIAVDPTFGQWPADATHIRLLTGDLDKQIRLASVIGKLKIEGLEYK